MANIKFSAFTQKVASADVDFLVGYTGGDNVRITPSVFDDRYVPLAGGTMTGNLRLNDGVRFQAGSSGDFNIRHNGVDSYLENDTGNLYIKQKKSDADIIFQSDDGSGGEATYFTVDGGDEIVKYNKNIKLQDNVVLNIGSNNDLQLKHDGSNSYVQNITGDLYIQNGANDKDVILRSDNGSGGIAEYVRLDGANVRTKFSKNTIHTDNIKANFGNGSDLQIYHDGSNNYIQGVTGDMYIQNGADDEDIIFRSDDGSGGQTEYFRVDGSSEKTIFSKEVLLNDGVFLKLGGGEDLQIYHDGGNSYIKDTGTGDLRIWADSPNISTASGNKIFYGNNGAAELYHTGGVKKFETTSTGVKITGVNQYADNAAALAGGLTVGDVYRTGDLLKIVN